MAGQDHGSEPGRDISAAWDEVGTRFADLGRVLKERQERRTDDESASPEEGREDAGPARQVIDALDDAFTSLGDAVRDNAFQREAKSTLDALGAALGVTFSELGDHLRQRFDKPRQ